MSLFRKLPLKFHNSISILTTTNRFFSNSNPFPDEPTSAYYDDLVNAAGRSRDFDTLHHLLNKRVKDGCFNTTNTFNFITITNTNEAILDELSQTLARLDNGFPRKSAYDSLITRLAKLNLIDESLRVVDAVARGGYGLNASSFHPILNVLTRKNEMESAWRVVDLMRKVEIPPDLTAYNYFLMTYCDTGNVASAAEMLTRMVGEEGVRADTRTYDALVLGACKVGKVEGALMLLRRMVDDGVPVLLSTHMYVVNALLRLGGYSLAVKYVKSYAGRDTWLDTQMFGCLASKLIKLKKIDEAKLVLKEMNQRGLKMGDRLRSYYEMNVEDKN